MTNCLNKAWRSTRYFLRVAILVTLGLVVQVSAQQTDKGDITNSWQPPLDELILPPSTDHEANKRLLNYIRSRAESGDAAAEYKFGCCYFQGQLVAKDDVEAVKWFRKTADHNYATAQVNLGYCYATGIGVKKDLVEAVKWYRKAAESVSKDDHDTIVQIGGVLIEAGEIEVGKQMLQESAQAGNPLAQLSLARLFESGELIPRDMPQALRWLTTAAERNRDEVQLADIRVKIAIIYRDGLAGQKNPREAFKWFLRSTDADERDAGKAGAMFLLSTIYREGILTPKDLKESDKWLQRAVEAESDLARCYRGQQINWNGIARVLNTNYFVDVVGRVAPVVMRKEARDWTFKEAGLENPVAQLCLGIAHLYAAWGFPSLELEERRLPLIGEAFDNFKVGTNWLIKAAQNGEPRAQVEVGNLFAHGWGVPKEDADAVRWYQRAAKSGQTEAMTELALRYRKGKGVPKSGAEAFKLYLGVVSKAKRQRDPTNPRDEMEFVLGAAQIALGVMARDGEGVPQNYVEAYAWFNLAAADGWSDAKSERDKLANMLPPDELAEAQRRSAAYLKSEPHGGPSGRSSPATTDDVRATGTGFLITQDGYIISNADVIEDATQVRLVTSTGLIAAKVVKADVANDLALLKVEGRFAPLPVTASRGAKLGGTVATVGFPNVGLQGFAPKLAKGEIASLSGAGDDARYFQISVPVQPGNSGGALVDERGNVVGVVSAKLSAREALAASGALPENVNYAVKSSYLLSFLESVPEVASKLKVPSSKEKKFEDVVTDVEQAAVLVLVY